MDAKTAWPNTVQKINSTRVIESIHLIQSLPIPPPDPICFTIINKKNTSAIARMTPKVVPFLVSAAAIIMAIVIDNLFSLRFKKA